MSESAGKPVRDPELLRRNDANGHPIQVLSGAWDIRALESRARVLKGRLEAAGTAVAWDLTAVQRLDHVGALLLWRAWGKRRPADLRLLPQHELFFAHPK